MFIRILNTNHEFLFIIAFYSGILLTSEDDINDDQDDDDIFLDGRLFHSSKVQQVENNVNVLFS